MDQESAKEIQQLLKKVDGGKNHFFAYHSGGDKGARLALDLRRMPLAETRKWQKEGLSASLLVTGVARAGKNGVEFATPDKSVPGGVATMQRTLRALSASDGITMLARATVLIEENLELKEAKEAPAATTGGSEGQGGSDAEQKARQRAVSRLTDINKRWSSALNVSLTGVRTLSKAVGAEDDDRSRAIGTYLSQLADGAPQGVEGAIAEVIKVAPKGTAEEVDKALVAARKVVNAGLDYIEDRAEILELVDGNAYGVKVGMLDGLIDPLMAGLDEIDALDAAV